MHKLYISYFTIPKKNISREGARPLPRLHPLRVPHTPKTRPPVLFCQLALWAVSSPLSAQAWLHYAINLLHGEKPESRVNCSSQLLCGRPCLCSNAECGGGPSDVSIDVAVQVWFAGTASDKRSIWPNNCEHKVFCNVIRGVINSIMGCMQCSHHLGLLDSPSITDLVLVIVKKANGSRVYCSSSDLWRPRLTPS